MDDRTRAFVVARLPALHRLAKAATPGPWRVAPGNFITAGCINDDPSSGRVVAEVPCCSGNPADVAFLAECDPQTISALVEFVDELLTGRVVWRPR